MYYSHMQNDTPNLKSVTFQTVDPNSEDQRLDNYLVKKLKGVPKSHIYRIIRKGEIRINKKRAKAESRLNVGDIVRIPPIRIASRESTVLLPGQKTQLNNCIIYEDDRILVLNKPPGLPVHAGSGCPNGIIERLRVTRSDLKYVELVHRLDRQTSGVLLVSKKASVLKEFQAQWHDDTVEKVYHAIVSGEWAGPETIDLPLLSKAENQYHTKMVVHPEGKESCTLVTTLEQAKNATLIEATLKTGRMHQIRVHTAYYKNPILGDDKYGLKSANLGLKAPRMALHAASLRLPGYPEPFKAELPADLAKFWARLSAET